MSSRLKGVVYTVGSALVTLIFIPIVVLVVLARKWVFVGFGQLVTLRIGHFARNTELVLCESDERRRLTGKRSVEIWTFEVKQGTLLPDVCNEQLALMWKRVMRIWPIWLVGPALKATDLVPGGQKHRLQSGLADDRDVLDLMFGRAPHLQFTQSEIELGASLLEDFGVPRDSTVVCLNVRDSAYLSATFSNDFSYHDYRDSAINDYVLAAETLAAEDCFVLRMGHTVHEPFDSHDPHLIDYANDRRRTAFLDIYLAWRCSFAISTGSGWDSVAAIFRKPILYVNHTPIGCMFTSEPSALAIFKWHVRQADGRRLSLAEIFETQLAYAQDSISFEQAGVSLIDNSPQEIRDASLEMWSRLQESWTPKSGDDVLQERFKANFNTGPNPLTGMEMHGSFRALCGAQILRDNPWFVADHQPQC